MSKVSRIDPPAPVLANAIKAELMGKLARGEVPAVGRDQIAAAIDDRKLDLSNHQREDLIGLVCRKIVFAASR